MTPANATVNMALEEYLLWYLQHLAVIATVNIDTRGTCITISV